MLFNSHLFIFAYLPIVFIGFFVISKKNSSLGMLWLGISSLFFYGWWNPKFVSLLMASIVLNFFFGNLIARFNKNQSKILLVTALVLNISLLIYFKYANFFLSNIVGSGENYSTLEIILPLGISFFTFTQIAFLVDVYKGIAREFNFLQYMLFVTWFPHLIAGPVLHHKQMMPQFSRPETFRPNIESISIGLSLFALGLAKKVLLADQFSMYASPLFGQAASGDHLMLVSAWFAALAYTLQLYFDFSGYSDMAVGLSRIFNIKLPINFDSPYKSKNIIEFWRRWHITLSVFLREYLYIPLGGNRKGKIRRYSNLMITMLLGGLWHGAGWNFILWGAIHGFLLVINYLWRGIVSENLHNSTRLSRGLSIFITFVAVVFAWVPFRATSIEATFSIWGGMLGLNGISVATSLQSSLAPMGVGLLFSGWFPGTALPIFEVISWIGFGLFIIWVLPNTQELFAKFSPAFDEVSGSYFSWKLTPIYGVMAGLLLAISIIFISKASEFLYFQF